MMRCSLLRVDLPAVLVCGPAGSPVAQQAAPTVRASKFELFVADARASVAFYEALGFEVVNEKNYGYTTLAAGETIVALSPIRGWLRFPVWLLSWFRLPPLGTELVFYTDDLGVAREALLGAGYAPGDVKLQPWGDHDFRITDPDGYYVRVTLGQPIPDGGSIEH
ncbi:MAG: glyoxalase [Myxococcota bacterium]|nr:glyoxalase [Myxococcota bacterium]